MRRRHYMPFGAHVESGGVRFRLWAPDAGGVELCLQAPHGRRYEPMRRDGEGWFELFAEEAYPGCRYLFRIDGGLEVPDPASRFQPDDVHAASEVIDPHAFVWEDSDWRGRPWEETVLYELHVGTFTTAGRFAAIQRRLDHLVKLGVTAVELMPVADFPGRRGWGYDGVLPFAPDSAYGRPDDLKRLVQAAHARGLMVFLDVVYNHFGPDGNYLHAYAGSRFFTDRHHTPWGKAINFDGEDGRVVRDFFIHNALYWLEEYHIDGLRLDAVHAIRDDSAMHILEELARTVRAELPEERHVHLVLENDANAVRFLGRARDGAMLYDAQWSDDVHHVLHVAATGETGGYYEDYVPDLMPWLGRALTEGFAYQGEVSKHRGGVPRGERSGHLPASCFVSFLQNHDQVGNRALGERLHALADEAAVRAVTAVLLLAPMPPLLFMGQEWGSRQPFYYFCDFHDDLADAVREGRRKEFATFPEFREPEARERIPDPNAPETFTASMLDWEQAGQENHRHWLELTRALLALRHGEIVPRLRGTGAGAFDLPGGRVLRARWRLGDGSTLHLRANLGAEAAPAGPPLPGRALFSLGAAGDALPPWSVGWTLEDAAA